MAMAVGDPCSIEGCKSPRMYNSPVCYKHKTKSEDVWWEDHENAVKPWSRSPFSQEWSAEYEGREIRVINEIHRKGVAKLYIDGELKDETDEGASMSIPRGEIWLSTELTDTGDTVDVRFRATMFSVKAKILVNKKQIGGDSFVNSPINEKVDSSTPGVGKLGPVTWLVSSVIGYAILTLISGVIGMMILQSGF
tara:strand:+ start:3988 stop:4569 length:582 start_codon:yes stop_codon:yes gene_type:complete